MYLYVILLKRYSKHEDRFIVSLYHAYTTISQIYYYYLRFIYKKVEYEYYTVQLKSRNLNLPLHCE